MCYRQDPGHDGHCPREQRQQERLFDGALRGQISEWLPSIEILARCATILTIGYNLEVMVGGIGQSGDTASRIVGASWPMFLLSSPARAPLAVTGSVTRPKP